MDPETPGQPSRNTPINRPRILHPFLFAVYPILALLAFNIEQTRLSAALRPLLFSLAGAAALFFLLNLFFKDAHRAGFTTTLLLALFFSYGQFYNYLENPAFLSGMLGRHRLLAPLWVALALLVLVMGFRSRRNFRPVTHLFNLLAAALLILPVLQIASYQVRSYQAAAAPSPRDPSQALHLPTGQPAPDIYYIILDGYSRDDMLEKFYGMDNRPFLSALEQLGFYVAPCSQSNYAQTQLSLASSLNLDYLDALSDRYTAGSNSRIGLAELIRHSRVRRSLENLGYTVVAFDTGYDATRLSDADVYLTPRLVAEINDFENLLTRTTAARIFAEGVSLLRLPPDWEKRDQAYRERILYSLDELEKMPALPGPKFVFAHIVAPHWPHVFGPDGQPVHERPDSVEGYRNQVLFINKRILPILQGIIQRSNAPPIIIVQGDHGAVIEDPVRRMSILNAYYLPGGSPALYPSISPVNSFRVIFNQVFDGAYPLLDDASYYSRYDKPYLYQQIPDQRAGCQP